MNRRPRQSARHVSKDSLSRAHNAIIAASLFVMALGVIALLTIAPMLKAGIEVSISICVVAILMTLQPLFFMPVALMVATYSDEA